MPGREIWKLALVLESLNLVAGAIHFDSVAGSICTGKNSRTVLVGVEVKKQTN